MRFYRGSLEEFEASFARMAVAHADEVGVLGAGRMLPSMGVYRQVESAGGLHLYLARDSKDRPAGYQAFVVIDHPHYMGLKWAQSDAMYVKPESRGYLGGKFMLWVDEQLRLSGVKVISRGFSVHMDHSHLFTRMGYHPQEVTYMKEL